MRLQLCLTLLLAAAVAEAGVVQGVVIENLSGGRLARARVRLQPVPKAGARQRPIETRVERSGRFTFLNVPDGLYLLIAEREGYFPCAYGTRRPSGQGRPITVIGDSSFFTDLRMFRKAAITGRVLDENGIGISGVPVFAYRSRLPVRAAGSGISDDRGVFRIHGLEPGKYWVRSATYTLDDGSGLLPTFGPESREIRDARVQEARLDADTSDADVRPEAGTLFRLGGSLDCAPLGMPVTVTLTSETGKRSTQSACGMAYGFTGLAPSRYEVLAEKAGSTDAGYLELFADRDTNASVTLRPLADVTFETRRGVPVTLTGRRRDLSELGSEREIKLPQDRLTPGHWEMTATTAPGLFVESIASPYAVRRRGFRAEQAQPPDAFDVFVEYQMFGRVQITVSDQVGQIRGKVTSEGNNAPGVPVFLWPVADGARRSLRGYVQMLSDTNGEYCFDSLPPGEYRILATFDLSEVDEQALDEARAAPVRVSASQTANVDLTVWVAP